MAEKAAAAKVQGGNTKDLAKPEARAVLNPALRQQGVSQSASAVQWDRFEVALSKPSGKQKLGMVLKHAQVKEHSIFHKYNTAPKIRNRGYKKPRLRFKGKIRTPTTAVLNLVKNAPPPE